MINTPVYLPLPHAALHLFFYFFLNAAIRGAADSKAAQRCGSDRILLVDGFGSDTWGWRGVMKRVCFSGKTRHRGILTERTFLIPTKQQGVPIMSTSVPVTG